jgi:hypothetical protein
VSTVMGELSGMIGVMARLDKDKSMATVMVTLNLPEELVRDARELDILTQESVAELLQAEVDRRVRELVNAEIHAHRAEKAAQSNWPQHKKPK